MLSVFIVLMIMLIGFSVMFNKSLENKKFLVVEHIEGEHYLFCVVNGKNEKLKTVKVVTDDLRQTVNSALHFFSLEYHTRVEYIAEGLQ